MHAPARRSYPRQWFSTHCSQYSSGKAAVAVVAAGCAVAVGAGASAVAAEPADGAAAGVTAALAGGGRCGGGLKNLGLDVAAFAGVAAAVGSFGGGVFVEYGKV